MTTRCLRLLGPDELAEGEMRCVHPGHGLEPVAIYRVEGRYHATQDGCTHAKASLTEGWLLDHEVICPVHEGRFDIRDGRPLCFPVTQALRTFPAELREDGVWVDLAAAQPAA